MSKITIMVPVFASAEFTCDKPDNWDFMSLEEKTDYFNANADRSGSICHQCTSSIECDWEIDQKWYDQFGHTLFE